MKTQILAALLALLAWRSRPWARGRPRRTAPRRCGCPWPMPSAGRSTPAPPSASPPTSTRVAEAQAQEARSALQPQLSAGGQLANETINLATFGFTVPGPAERDRAVQRRRRPHRRWP